MGFYPPSPPAPPRAILGALAAGKSAPAVASPDAELIGLCARYEDLHRQWLAFYDTIEDDDERAVAQEPLSAPTKATLDGMCSLRATTAEGFRARGKAFAVFAPERIEEWQDDYCHDKRMAGALLRDLAGGNVVPASTKAPVPDEALIVVCDRLLAISERREALYEVRETRADELRTQPEMDALDAEWKALIERISSLPQASTLTGAKAMARVAIAFASRDADGDITTDNDGDWLAYSVLELLVGSAAA